MVHRLLATVLLSSVLIGPSFAQVDSTEVITFDEVGDEAPGINTQSSWTDMIHVSGRFDVVMEVENPTKEADVQEARVRNYHKFLFLKVTPTDRITLDAEVLDLSYYELQYELAEGVSVRAGKIWVPFGATPFHHYYGGAQGDPFDGLFLPNVWSEFGASVSGTILNGSTLHAEADAYVIRGFEADSGAVLQFTGGGADDRFAVGGRTRLGIGEKLSIWGSVLYNRFGAESDNEVLLWGGDVLADYGLVDLPALRDLRLRAAFARAEVRDDTVVDPLVNPDFWYFRYGDYAELTYRGIPYVQPRLRFGSVIDFDDRITNQDSHTWDLALLSRLGRNLMLLAEYQFNLEEVNEIDNDLFRFQVVFEF